MKTVTLTQREMDVLYSLLEQAMEMNSIGGIKVRYQKRKVSNRELETLQHKVNCFWTVK